jgi:hypothetical protein
MLNLNHKVKIILKAINMGHPIGAKFLPKLTVEGLYNYARTIADKKLIELAADITINKVVRGEL